jgi:hypothetical protein
MAASRLLKVAVQVLQLKYRQLDWWNILLSTLPRYRTPLCAVMTVETRIAIKRAVLTMASVFIMRPPPMLYDGLGTRAITTPAQWQARPESLLLPES